MELKIEYLKITDLKPYDKNTRKHADKDVKNIAESIKKYGFNDPIGIYGDENVIVEGHGRLMAAKRLKMTEVPCVRLDHMTDEQRREYAIAHNATAELSEWDFDVLADEIADLDFGEFDFTFQDVFEGERNLDNFVLKDNIKDIEKDSYGVTLTFKNETYPLMEKYIKDNTRRGLERIVIREIENYGGAENA